MLDTTLCGDCDGAGFTQPETTECECERPHNADTWGELCPCGRISHPPEITECERCDGEGRVWLGAT